MPVDSDLALLSPSAEWDCWEVWLPLHFLRSLLTMEVPSHMTSLPSPNATRNHSGSVMGSVWGICSSTWHRKKGLRRHLNLRSCHWNTSLQFLWNRWPLFPYYGQRKTNKSYSILCGTNRPLSFTFVRFQGQGLEAGFLFMFHSLLFDHIAFD